jgi:hypothetical protein
MIDRPHAVARDAMDSPAPRQQVERVGVGVVDLRFAIERVRPPTVAVQEQAEEPPEKQISAINATGLRPTCNLYHRTGMTWS